MNEYDIVDAVRRWSYDPVLGPATRTLHHLMRAVNSNSDGWPYWQAPRRASKMLQALVTEPPKDREAQKLAYKRALTPLKRFRTAKGIHFEIEDVR
jgi:hypothetical protein